MDRKSMVNKKLAAILGTAIATLAVGQPALAQDGDSEAPVVRLHNNISLSGGATYQNYKETIDGDTVDKETGWIPNIKGSASYMSPKHWLVSVGVRYSFGDTDYDGQTIVGGIPVTAKTENNIVSVNLKIGKGFLITDRFMVTPFATYGHRYWDRGLSGYNEQYNMNYLGAGVMLDYQATSRIILSARGMGGGTFANTMHESVFGTDHELGSEAIAKAQLKADYRFYKNWHLFAAANYTYFQFGKSDKKTVLGIYEPDSTTHNVSLNAGISYTY